MRAVHNPDLIAVALIHPDTPHAAAYLHGRQLGYTERGWMFPAKSARYSIVVVGSPHSIPGPRDTARFRLISSPTEDVSEESVLACVTGDPFIVHLVLTELRPGDVLRVAGMLTLPDRASGAVQLQVDALEVLKEVPLTLAETADEAEAEAADQLTFDRYGDYVVIFDGDTDAVPVFTARGKWIGLADNPDAIATLIDIHERVTGGDA
ncbi:hypothetical protein ACFXPZ_18040 [Streptomyces sp. NPDC059101]|uniref:hypothetical protein n=1 Tax=Streptomyces sp. NPDC059101 TaxID=3346728 RepID=UPI0036AE91EA